MSLSAPPMEQDDLNLPEEDAIIDSSQGNRETILFVEDNDLMREVGIQILEDLGYQVFSACNGREALKVFNEMQDIDLIFTDIIMPDMGGLAMLREIRQSGSQVKALAVTGHMDVEDVGKLREVNVTSIIRKPYDFDILADEIRKALDTA